MRHAKRIMDEIKNKNEKMILQKNELLSYRRYKFDGRDTQKKRRKIKFLKKKSSKRSRIDP